MSIPEHRVAGAPRLGGGDYTIDDPTLWGRWTATAVIRDTSAPNYGHMAMRPAGQEDLAGLAEWAAGQGFRVVPGGARYGPHSVTADVAPDAVLIARAAGLRDDAPPGVSADVLEDAGRPRLAAGVRRAFGLA